MNLVDLFKEYNGRYPKGNVQDELHAWCEAEIKRQAQRIAELEAQVPQSDCDSTGIAGVARCLFRNIK